ncbi:MAG: hypothetical protein R2855_12585 [Thermomicrobiales bacterium]
MATSRCRSLLPSGVAPFSPPGSHLHRFRFSAPAAIAWQLPDIPESNLLVEPGMRGTGNAIALAALLLIAQRDPHAVMGSFAADHKIANTDEFHRAPATAIRSAEAGYLTTIGIEPSHPERDMATSSARTTWPCRAGTSRGASSRGLIWKPRNVS